MSLLDILLRILAYSIVVVPIAILIIGIILFFYKPIHRLTVGALLVAFGSLGLTIYSISFYIALTRGQGVLFFMAILAVEVMTIITGIISLTHSKSANQKM